MNKTIFVVTHDGNIRNSEFFSTKQLARIALKSIANDRRHKLGVSVVVNEEDKFSFIVGWEEHKVTFSVVELPIT